MTKTVDFILYSDGNGEIIEDLNNPAYIEAGNIKKRVMMTLDMREWDEYMKLKGVARTQYIRNLALKL